MRVCKTPSLVCVWCDSQAARSDNARCHDVVAVVVVVLVLLLLRRRPQTSTIKSQTQQRLEHMYNGIVNG